MPSKQMASLGPKPFFMTIFYHIVVKISQFLGGKSGKPQKYNVKTEWALFNCERAFGKQIEMLGNMQVSRILVFNFRGKLDRFEIIWSERLKLMI